MTLLTMDPTSAASVQAAFETVTASTEGKLDYLVNNAGQTVIMPTLDFNIAAAKEMFEINVWGLIRTTQVFVPLLVAAQGTIINISSISTVVHTPWMGESLLARSYSNSPSSLFCFTAKYMSYEQASTPALNAP